MTSTLTPRQRERLRAFGDALIDQHAAHPIIEPQERSPGFWYGGGTLVEAPDGTFYLSGRYRNYGDSRTGLGAGTRGWQLAIFASKDQGTTFSKVVTFSKANLSTEDRPVLSIEGSTLHLTPEGVELYVSSEKGGRAYPDGLQSYQKPGTGIWSIDRLVAPTIAALPEASIEPLLGSDDPRFLHVKDPFLYQTADKALILGFCTHPYNWSSSNSGYAVRVAGAKSFSPPVFDFFRRGFTWDVGISRLTTFLRIPRVGLFEEGPTVTLAFYDGGESMRAYEQHQEAVRRPRGYSCEEIGGLAAVTEENPATIERLAIATPAFISPWGTGSSRYVDVLSTEVGFYATWEQSQPDGSQPLVMNFISRRAAAALLS